MAEPRMLCSDWLTYFLMC